ncbi:MAG: hypothetical protein DRJ13_17760 [Bacteroidetes bacterium]|nr:MAG: hypothetical protein DRJ13_17760 [Bacteroidota bacterium]
MERGTWRGYADLALFWTEYEDMIEFTFGVYPPDPNDIPSFDDVGFKALNIGRARINGVDTKLSAEGTAGALELSLSGGYTLMNPVDPLFPDSVLKYRRRHLIKGDLQLGIWKIFAGINFQYNSKMVNVDEAFLDPLVGNMLLPGFPDYWEEHTTAYSLLDFRLGWNITEMLRVSAILRNSFNVEYLGRPGDIGPPRNITLQLHLDL